MNVRIHEQPKKRTLASIKRNARTQSLGCKNAPLLELELDHIVPDELHLLLRVMDMLIQALVDTAVAQDHYEAHDRGQSSINAEDGPKPCEEYKRVWGAFLCLGT